GAYADLQYFYRRGLASLDAYCRKTYKEPFQRLSAAQQDEVIAALEQGKASEFSWPSPAAFFNTVRTHTMEGMFADPIYGGNKDFAGWRLVGFPGSSPRRTCRAADRSRGCPSSDCRLRPVDGEDVSHGNRKNRRRHRRRGRGRRYPRSRARQGGHEGHRPGAWAAPDHARLRSARRIALFPAPGSAPEHQASAHHLAAQCERAR